MARRPKKLSPSVDQMSGSSGLVAWKTTKNMNMRDLARDDDYLSHLFIEKLGNIGADLGATAPMLVHKMDPFRRLPKTDMVDILAVVQQLVNARPSGPTAVKQAVNELLELPSVLYFIKDYEQSQINAFATHASRYLELFLPSGSIEIAQTSRYSRITGKSELCILATRPMQPGFLIAELKGSMADLTEEEDKELKRAGSRGDGGMRRDFSVIHSKQLKKNHLFLGPARFVNHDCENNVELFRNGRYITFRAVKPIAVGQELTAHYGDGYFGRNNRHCLCETCERRGRGGYAPQSDEEMAASANDSDNDSEDDSDSSSLISSSSDKDREEVNLNERRTRRGVYLVIPEQHDSSDEDDDDEVEVSESLSRPFLDSVGESGSEAVSSAPCTSLGDESDAKSHAEPSAIAATAEKPKRGRPPKAIFSHQIHDTSSSARSAFKSVITTRSQKAREASQPGSPIDPGRSSSRSSGCSAVSSSEDSVHNLRSRVVRDNDSPSISAPLVPRPRGRPRKYPMPAEIEKDKGLAEINRLGHRDSVTPTRATAEPAATSEKNSSDSPAHTAPTCINCLAPLPTEMSGHSRRGKAKEIREECARCRCHFMIYNAPWPHRYPTPGTRSASTRENTPSEFAHKLTHTAMSSMDLALRAARLSQLKRSRDSEQDADCERLGKKHKAGASSAGLQYSPSIPNERVNIPTNRTKGVLKVENDEEISLRSSTGRETSSVSADPRIRGKGYPSSQTTVDSEDLQIDDRRDKTFWPVLPDLPPAGQGIKRTGLLNLRPNPMHVSRWRASPMHSSQSSDSTPTLVEDDTDDGTSDEHPSTPSNHANSLEAGTNAKEHEIPPDSDEDSDEIDDNNGDKSRMSEKLAFSTLKGLGLISKPSPLALSKRIWAPSPTLVDDLDFEQLNSLGSGELTTPKKKHRKCASTPSSKLLEHWVPSDPSVRTERAPVSQVQTEYLDDLDASSGEEDVIVPGPSDSKLYRLQSKVTFSSSASLPDEPSDQPSCFDGVASGDTANPAINLKLPCDTPSDASSHASQLRPNTLGPLHSEFLKSVADDGLSPTFVNAGWDSDSSA